MQKLILATAKALACIALTLFNTRVSAQADFTTVVKTEIVKSITTHFFANPNDALDDTWAFIKAGKYISNEWREDGTVILPGDQKNYDPLTQYIKLEIPASTNGGTYIVGKQIDVTCAGIPSPGITYASIFGTTTGNAKIVIPKNNNGAILIKASGGGQPYQYSIDGGVTWGSSYLIQGRSPGNYNVVVKDAAGCTTSTVVATVGNPTSPDPNTLAVVDVNVTNTTCGSSNGSVVITGTGGIKPYTFKVDGVTYTGTSTLAAGTHTYTIQDASSIPFIRSGTFNVANGPTILYKTERSTCASTYTITFTSPLNNTTETFEYSINGTTYQSSPIFTGLANGTHTIYARKVSTTCANSASVNTQFVISSVTTEAPTCGHSYKYGLELMTLIGVDQVKIVGTGGSRPKIKYKGNLVIGYYNGTTQDFNRAPYGIDYNYFANIGSCILSNNCKNVLIQYIDIDGNNTPPTTTYGGGLFGNEGIQLGADGVALYNTQNITIIGVSAHHMTRDGLAIGDNYYEPGIPTQVPAQNPQQHSSVTSPRSYNTNLLMTYSNYNNNRRQGFSWTGGKNITVDSCTFSYTGKPTYNWNGGIANGNPAAGMDIEPESYYDNQTAITTWLTCSNGTFTNCDFIDNMGQAMVNDVQDRVTKMYFTNCKFHDVTGYAVWATGKDLNFNNCKIWGGFVHGNQTNGANDGTKFTNCDFADEDISGSTFAGSYINIETNSARKMRLTSCTTRTIHNGVRNLWMNIPGYFPESDYPAFTNCVFTNGASHTPVNNDYLARCVFDGTNSYTNLNTSVQHGIFAKGLVFKGSTNACSPNSFTLAGMQQILYNQNFDAPSDLIFGRNGTSGTDGYFDFNINDKAFLYNYWWSTLNVGNNSTIRTRTGGTIYTKGGGAQTVGGPVIPSVINNNGKMIFEPGSYSSFPSNSDNPINIIGGAQSEVYFHKSANSGVNPAWAGPDFGSFPIYSYPTLQNVLFDGGHLNIPTTPTNLNTSFNEALLFNGTNQYLKMPSNVVANWIPANARTVEIAFKKNTPFLEVEGLLYEKGALNIKLSPTIISVQIGSLNANVPLSDASCHFLTITKGNSDDKLRVYLDGELKYTSTAAITNNLITPTFASNLGAATTSPSSTTLVYFFKGWIGQYRLWSTELTQQDICRNFKRKEPLSNAGLMANWDMTDASTSTTVANSVDAADFGALVNSPTWVSQFSVGDCTDASTPPQNNSSNNFRIANNTAQTTQEAIEESKVNIYPNPNSGEFTLLLNSMRRANKKMIIIYNADGKSIFAKALPVTNISTYRINLGNVPNGVYMIKVIGDDDTFSKRIVVNK